MLASALSSGALPALTTLRVAGNHAVSQQAKDAMQGSRPGLVI